MGLSIQMRGNGGWILAHNYNPMDIDKLRHKYDRSTAPIFQSDMSMQIGDTVQNQSLYLNRGDKFSNALSALHQNYCPGQINARDQERSQIRAYLQAGIAAKGCSESLYVSGVPGIGKTLCVKQVAKQVCEQKNAKLIYVNALTIKKPNEIFKVIQYEMTRTKIEANNALYQLDNYFEKQIQMQGFNEKDFNPKVLIIDEIDFLKTRDEQVLYSIFEWTQKKKSKLIIISISNTLDFPQTLSGKIASRMGRKKIGFAPYTSQQIEKILMERIGSFEVFHEQALTYICKKIAQISSDIRKCLFILRETITQFLIDNGTKNVSKMKIPLDILAKTQQKIYNDTFAQNFHEFPAAYKIVLYCLAKFFRSDTHLCTMRQLQALLGTFIKSRNQLIPILLDLRDLGIIKITYNYFKEKDTNCITSLRFQNLKQMKEQHIKLQIDYDRIFAALQKENLKEINFNVNLTF